MGKIFDERMVRTDRLVTTFKLHTAGKPGYFDIMGAQIRLGYDPRGYGGPSRIMLRQQSNKTWVTIWSCAGSSD